MGVRDADRVRAGLAGRLRVSEAPSVFFRDYELSGVIRQYSPPIVEGDAGLILWVAKALAARQCYLTL